MELKKLIFAAIILCSCIVGNSQDLTKLKLYHPEENAKHGIAAAVKEAKESGKHVLVEIGGNWCIWCARFNDFVTSDKSIDSLVNADYVVYHMNYSKENYNTNLLAKYGYPQRFGFPVFLILDADGNLIHIQNSGYLEKDKSYDRNVVIGFFKDWSPAAFVPTQYKEQ